jgi:hypothetical protein
VGPGPGAAVKALFFYTRMLFSSRRESKGDQMTEKNSSPSTVSEEVAWGQVSDMHGLVFASNASQSVPNMTTLSSYRHSLSQPLDGSHMRMVLAIRNLYYSTMTSDAGAGDTGVAQPQPDEIIISWVSP